MALPDVEKILKEWGLQGRSAGKEYYALCPLHDDNTPSMSINLRTGAWVCYTGCGSGKSIFTLGARIFNVSSSQIELELERFKYVPTTDELLAELNTRAEDIMARPSYERDFAYTVAGVPRWFIDRGFDAETISQFGIRGNTTDHSVQFPIFFRNEYLGIIKRLSPTQAKIVGYRYHYTIGFDKSKILFGWDELVNRQLPGVKLHRVVLTEGPLDAMWCQRYGLPAVSILGAYISDEQIKILRLEGIEEIYLMMDDDVEGEIAKDKIISRTQEYFGISVFNYPPKTTKKQDPQDMKPEQLHVANFTEWSPI